MRQDVKLTLYDATFAITSGYETMTTTTSVVWAERRSVTRNEFYQASQAGYKADAVFDVYAFEYAGQEIVEADNIKYKVVRTYQKSLDVVELTCQRRDEK